MWPEVALSVLIFGTLYSIVRVIQRRRSNPLWKLRGPKGSSILLGSIVDTFSLDGLQYQDKLIDEYGLVARTTGVLGAPSLYVGDPAALHQIVFADSYNWPHPSSFTEMGKILFGPGLLSAHGPQHKKQRKVLNPLFTPAHTRGLTPIFYHVAHQLVDKITSEIKRGGSDTKEVDVLSWACKAALEFIAQGGMGYTFDALETDTNEYNGAVNQLFPTMRAILPASILVPVLNRVGTVSLRKWAVGALSPLLGEFGGHILRFKSIMEVMEKTTVELYERKKDAINRGEIEDVGQGKDIMALLLKAAQSTSASDNLTEEEMRAQMTTLILAGHETTSGALARTLHVLSNHPDIQEKLRAEVTEARAARGDLEYDDISSLPYLHDVCREIFRLYPPVAQLPRTNTVDTVIPLQFPIKSQDGKTEIKELAVPKGTMVQIGIRGMGRSKEIWGDDASEFKPERWQNLPKSMTDIRIPGVFGSSMTFLAGPRACIGYKFALLEYKIVLSLLVSAFSFAPTEKDIRWFMGPTAWPAVRGEEKNGQPRLPLNVTLL